MSLSQRIFCLIGRHDWGDTQALRHDMMTVTVGKVCNGCGTQYVDFVEVMPVYPMLRCCLTCKKNKIEDTSKHRGGLPFIDYRFNMCDEFGDNYKEQKNRDADMEARLHRIANDMPCYIPRDKERARFKTEFGVDWNDDDFEANIKAVNDKIKSGDYRVPLSWVRGPPPPW